MCEVLLFVRHPSLGGVVNVPTMKLFRKTYGRVESGILIVDYFDEDLLTTSWRYHPEGYAVRGRGRPGSPSVYAHRIVAERIFGEIPPGHVVDHVNHNRLDNRRSNLRVVPNEENLARNRKPADFKTCAACRTRSRKVAECPLCLIPLCPVCNTDHSC